MYCFRLPILACRQLAATKSMEALSKDLFTSYRLSDKVIYIFLNKNKIVSFADYTSYDLKEK